MRRLAWDQYSADRKGKHPADRRADDAGVIRADGHTGFNVVLGPDLASEQACGVHIRRKFGDVFEQEGAATAKEAIERIAPRDTVEKAIRYCAPEAHIALRQEKPKPVFDALERWLAAQLPKISGKFNLAKAIRYTLNRRPTARPDLENRHLKRDNNPCERSIRPIALGR